MPPKLTPQIITAAIAGFEGQKAHIDAQIAELRAMLSGSPAEHAATPEPAPKKRKVSAAARRRMALGQKKRWAAIKKGAESQSTPEPAKPKRKLSDAGRKAIADATRKRWAAKRAEAAKAEPAVAKKARAKKAAVKKVAAKGAGKKGKAKKAAKAPEQTETATA